MRRGDLEQSNVAWEGVWLKYAVFALKQMSAFLVNGENLLSGNFYFYFFSQKTGASESVNQEIESVWPYVFLAFIQVTQQRIYR